MYTTWRHRHTLFTSLYDMSRLLATFSNNLSSIPNSLLCSLCSSRKHQFFTQTQWTNVWVVFPVFPSNSHEKPRVCANLKSCNSDKMCSHIKTEVITGFTFDTINLLLSTVFILLLAHFPPIRTLCDTLHVCVRVNNT